MARQIYFRGEAGPGNVNLPSMPNVTNVPRVDSQLADIAKGVAETAKAWGQAYIKYDDERQKGLVDDAYLKARSEMMRWQTEYNRTHQGADALSAQADYESQWQKISDSIVDQYGEKVSGQHAHLLKRSMELGRLYALRDGDTWQTKQQAAWDKNKTLLLQANVEDAIDSGDLARAQMERQRLIDHLGRAMSGLSIEPAMKKIDRQLTERHATNLIAQGKLDEAERLLYNGGGSTQTGRYRVLAKHESGTQGSQHVSYGLPVTDGVDVGKFSFITKGGNGGSVGDFIRWAGTQGGIGKKLHDAMHEVVGGDWNKLDSKELWKTKAADIWREAAKSDPKAFEELEDRFMGGRIDKEIAKLKPEVQEAIKNDKTGALYEMAASTINQHATALNILNNNFNSDPETYIRQVYKDRGNPARFARTHDPNMGKRRMDQEVQDVLSIYRGGSNQKREPMFVAYDNPQGLVEKGNIDLASRPKVKNSDGSISTVRSASFNVDGKEVLLPTVSEDGRLLSEDEAIENYKKTGKHLGKFDSVENANAYAQKLHEQQEQMYAEDGVKKLNPNISPDKALVLQGKIDRARRERAQAVGLTTANLNNHLSYGIDSGKWDPVEQDIELLKSYGMHKEADSLNNQLIVSKAAYNVINDVSDLPLVQQNAEAIKRINSLITPENAKHATTVKKHIADAMQKRQTEFIKNPAKYVNSLPYMQNVANPEERVTKSLELQKKLGKGLFFAEQALPKQEAEALRAQFDKLENGEDRAKFILQNYYAFGKHSEKVFQEMKLPSTMSALLPMIAGGLPEKELGICLTAIVAKPSDFPHAETDERTMNADLTSADNFPLYQAALSLSNMFVNDDRLRTFAKGIHTMAYNYLRLTHKDNLDAITDCFSLDYNDDSFILLPAKFGYGYDAEDVGSAVSMYKQSEVFKNELVKKGTFSNKTMNRYDAVNADTLIDNIVFVSANDYKSLYLLDKRSQRIIADKNNDPVTIEIKDVLKAYGSESSWERFSNQRNSDGE